MRNVKWIAATALLGLTTGCVETNQGYGYNSGYGYTGGNNGYSTGYYPSSSGYYARQAPVNNYYYNPQPTVVTQTRYVPVPTPAPPPPRQSGWSNDNRWGARDNDGHRPPPRVDRPNNPPPPPQASNNNGPRPGPAHGGQSNRPDGNNNRDRDGDGRPDRRG